jgi:hypothetical protein
MYTSTSQHLEASQAKEMKKFGTAVNATCHGFGSPWSFIHLFIYLHSMEPHKVTEPYGCGNSQQILQLCDYSNDMRGLIVCPMVLLLYPLWIN